MRRGKPNIEKRPAGPPKPEFKEVRLKIREKTAKNIIQMNAFVSQKQQELADAAAQMQNHILPLITEAGLEKGEVVQVTDKPPWELVIRVPK